MAQNAAMKEVTTIRRSALPYEAKRLGRPSREEQARREDVVLDVALDEFIVEGLNGANIETIARKAGVGKSTIYRKYENKQGLLLAVARRRMTELGERWEGFNFDIDDPEGTLHRLAILSYREWTGKSMPIYRIIYTEAERIPDIAQAIEKMTRESAIAPVQAYFQLLNDCKFIDVRDVAEATSLFLMISARAMRSFFMPVELDDKTRSQQAEDAVQLFLYGYATKRQA